jgi:hypothetical protein
MARIFFFTMFLRWFGLRSGTVRIFVASESHTIREFTEAGKPGNRLVKIV